MQRFLDTYWILYFIGYLIAIVALSWHFRDDLRAGENWIFLLAAIFGAAAGSASAVAIIVETGGRLVLLIPPAVRKIMERGREEGREEGRQAERAEWEAWLARRNEAEANNLPFDEPPPSHRK